MQSVLRSCVFLLVFTLCGQPCMAAVEEPRTVDRAALLDLARKFVDRMEKGFDEADRYLETLSPDDLRAQKLFDTIPDGEPLLLQVKLGKLLLEEPILSIKQGRDVMISLNDFVTVASFAIDIRPEEKIAEGWFIRENQPFRLDGNAGVVVSKDETFPIGPGEVEYEDGDILVKGQSLARWLDFNLITNTTQQYMEVTSGQKWPPQEKAERNKKKGKNPNVLPPPRLPRQEQPYEVASLSRADVSLRQTYNKGPDLPKPQKRSDYTVQVVGDLAKHGVRATASGNDENKLNSAYVNFRKESEKKDLLGRLKARHYEFGDVQTVPVPYSGSAPSEIGMRISNKDPSNTTSALTQISGNSWPGWDVELYRNDQFMGIGTVGDTGRYIFDDIPLFNGTNRFRAVQYGPQGEIREEEQVVFVSPSVYSSKAGIYDVSLSTQNTQTWLHEPSEDPDRNTPHIAATYARQIGPNLSLHGGLQARQENEVNKAYVSTGAVTSFAGGIVNADFVYDLDGYYKAALTARRQVGSQNLAAYASYDSEGFSPGSINNTRPSSIFLRTVSNGRIPQLSKYQVQYEAGSSYTINGNDTSQYSNDLSVSGRFKRLMLSHMLTRSVRDLGFEEQEDTVGALSVRGRALKTAWRTVVNYNIKPELGLDNYFLRLSRGLTKKLDADLEIKQEVLKNNTIGELALNWQGDKVTISPTVSYDTNRELEAYLNVRFGLAKDPHTGDIIMSGKHVTNSGGVSALVFLDRDGDMKFSEGDELLPGVVIEAIHARKEAETNEKGEAFLFNLPVNRVTDIVVEENSNFDATWIAGFEGVSVNPRAGYTTRVEFPIHISGDIDGTVYTKTDIPGDEPKAARNIDLALRNMKGEVVQYAGAATDGFYVFTRVPPGKYYLMVDTEELKKKRNIESPLPQIIDIGYEGTTIYGNNIVMRQGDGAVIIDMIAEIKEFKERYSNFDFSGAEAAGQAIVLNLGDYKSRLSMALKWYKMGLWHKDLLAGTEQITDISESKESEKAGDHTLRLLVRNGDMGLAREKCRSFIMRDMTCSVEIVPMPAPEPEKPEPQMVSEPMPNQDPPIAVEVDQESDPYQEQDADAEDAPDNDGIPQAIEEKRVDILDIAAPPL